ncbi:MAG: tryptophan synthase subunit alpha [Propionibacteriaceae bacterium]|nr:tryptophan synthase subunit alpha [Propionibacteriaceae bacterium]
MSFDTGKTGAALTAAKAEGRAALIGFMHVGYPDVPTSLNALRAMARTCDVVEIGLPYSDPVMDGAVIQRTGTTALARGVRTKDAFAAAEAVTEAGGRAVVMTYWNLVERYGVDRFARDFANAGGCGLITPDLTPDEAGAWMEASDEHGLDRIFLVAPSSTDERIASTVDACRGWVYATAVMGVTGAREQSSTAAPELVRRIRALRPDVPIGIGLGVSGGKQAREIAQFADGVIVGSALVRTLIAAEDAGDPSNLSGLQKVLDDLAAGCRG